MNKNKTYKYVLSLGHLCSDINQGALSAVLPFLIAAYNYNYTTAAMLVTVSNVFGSIVQPIFGNIADKKNKPWIISLGVFLACIGMALTGFTSNFYYLCIAVIISGIGNALFHPQAAQLVSLSTDKNSHGKGISIFSFGGKLGFTLGPVLTAFFITSFGMKGTIAFLIPSLIFGFVSSFFMKDFEELGMSKMIKQQEKNEVIRKDDWKGFINLCIVVFGKSIVSNGMSTFLALYFIKTFMQSESFGNTTLSIYYAIGAIATLIGGGISDKYGHQKIIKICFTVFFPSLIIFTITHNFIFALIMLIPLSCSESLSYSPIVVLGQEYLPNHTGFASGVTLGLAVSIGAILCPILGIIADTYSLTMALYVIAGVGAISMIASYFLPKVE